MKELRHVIEWNSETARDGCARNGPAWDGWYGDAGRPSPDGPDGTAGSNAAARDGTSGWDDGATTATTAATAMSRHNATGSRCRRARVSSRPQTRGCPFSRVRKHTSVEENPLRRPWPRVDGFPSGVRDLLRRTFECAEVGSGGLYLLLSPARSLSQAHSAFSLCGLSSRLISLVRLQLNASQ